MKKTDRWIQVIENENSVKLRDSLGNFVLLPKIELTKILHELIVIDCKNKGKENVH